MGLMKERNIPVWGIILLILMPISLCLLVILGAFFLLGFSIFTPAAISVGPTFTSPGALAADVVFETTGADAGSIVVLQEARQGEFQAVLVGYTESGTEQSRFLFTRERRDEFLVANGRPGRRISSDDLRAATHFIEEGPAAYVAITGEIYNADVAAVEIMWADDAVIVETETRDGFHSFLWFSPAPAINPQPHTVRALDADGNVISALALGP